MDKPEMPEWRCISTAPKDGTWILAIKAGLHPEGYPFVAAVVQWKDGAWRQTVAEKGDESWDLSHWMPLPKPPAHEPEPVDLLLHEARTIVVNDGTRRTENQNGAILEGRAGQDKVDLALAALRRGMELAQRGVTAKPK